MLQVIFNLKFPKLRNEKMNISIPSEKVSKNSKNHVKMMEKIYLRIRVSYISRPFILYPSNRRSYIVLTFLKNYIKVQSLALNIQK